MNPDAQLPASAWELQASKLSHIMLRPLLSQKSGAPRRANLPAHTDARKTIEPARYVQKTCAVRFKGANSLGKGGIKTGIFHHPDDESITPQNYEMFFYACA
jgi:hypothetical protein